MAEEKEDQKGSDSADAKDAKDAKKESAAEKKAKLEAANASSGDAPAEGEEAEGPSPKEKILELIAVAKTHIGPIKEKIVLVIGMLRDNKEKQAEIKEKIIGPWEKNVKPKLQKLADTTFFLPVTIGKMLWKGNLQAKLIAIGILGSIVLTSAAVIKFSHQAKERLVEMGYIKEVQKVKRKKKSDGPMKSFGEFVHRHRSQFDLTNKITIGPMTLMATSEHNPEITAVDFRVTIVTDGKRSSLFYKKREEQAQDAIISAVEPFKVDHFKTKKGKIELRKICIDALHRLGRPNSVKDVYFADFFGN